MNIEAIEREIARTEQRIESYREKLRTLRQRKVNEENHQILRTVKASNLSISDLQALLSPPPNVLQKEEKEDETDVEEI